jgi:hypothetical protein
VKDRWGTVAEQTTPAMVSGEVLMSGGILRTRYMIPTVICGMMMKNCHIPPMMSIYGPHLKTKRTIEKIFLTNKKERYWFPGRVNHSKKRDYPERKDPIHFFLLSA